MHKTQANRLISDRRAARAPGPPKDQVHFLLALTRSSTDTMEAGNYASRALETAVLSRDPKLIHYLSHRKHRPVPAEATAVAEVNVIAETGTKG